MTSTSEAETSRNGAESSAFISARYADSRACRRDDSPRSSARARPRSADSNGPRRETGPPRDRRRTSDHPRTLAPRRDGAAGGDADAPSVAPSPGIPGSRSWSTSIEMRRRPSDAACSRPYAPGARRLATPATRTPRSAARENRRPAGSGATLPRPRGRRDPHPPVVISAPSDERIPPRRASRLRFALAGRRPCEEPGERTCPSDRSRTPSRRGVGWGGAGEPSRRLELENYEREVTSECGRV